MADDTERRPCGCVIRHYVGIGQDITPCQTHSGIPCARPVGTGDLCRLPYGHRGDHDGAFAAERARRDGGA